MRDIILLHGAIGASDQLDLLADQLRQKNFNVYTFNFSGHGKTPFQAQFGIEQFAKELERFIKNKNLIRPVIFGYSMGGFVALYLATKQSSLLGNIITLGTKFKWSPDIAKSEIKMLDTKTIIEKVPKFAESLKNRHGDEWVMLLQKTSEMMLYLGENNLLNSDDLSQIDNKVLIGLADKDTMVSLDETYEVQKQLKHGMMYMLPNAKHPIETVNVRLLTAIIDEFNLIP